MTNDIKLAIDNLKGKASVARDHATHHADRAKWHSERATAFHNEAVRYEDAIEALREVSGGGTRAADVFDDGVYPPVPKPMEVLAVPEPFPAPAPKPQRANGLDRALIKRKLKVFHIRYPLQPSRRRLGQFVRQCLIAACLDHPDYREYVNIGGQPLGGRYSRTQEAITAAVEFLGLDRQKIVDEARVLHELITTQGEPGRDYEL